MFVNLLSNAIKYGRRQPIDVDVSQEGGQAVVRIRDRGIGVAAVDQERIFDRFERAVPSRHYGGLGLGLWIARQIVEASDDRIEAKSTLGEGATFTVTLPIGGVDDDDGA